MIENFGEEEISVIRTIFDSFDIEREGRIHINQLSSMLYKLGKKEEDIVQLTDSAAKIADDNGGLISFDEIIDVFKKYEKSKIVFVEGADPKVLEFLRILEDYRVQCETSGNYLEASRAHKQLNLLRKQEERRQQKVIQARHISERQDVQLAHTMQFNEFNKSWEKYLDEYDQMAQVYIQQMTERHAIVLLEFQKKLREELASKPPKWSKELLDQRRKQHINARNKNYAMAQKLKKLSDLHEQQERKEMEQMQAIAFARREAKFRQQQQTELQALLKRIECRRKEHVKQRELDTKKLLQRNRNVQAVLENKQQAEQQKLFAQIKKNLYSSAVLGHPKGAKTLGGSGGQASSTGQLGETGGKKKIASPMRNGETETATAGYEAGGYHLPSDAHRAADRAFFAEHARGGGGHYDEGEGQGFDSTQERDGEFMNMVYRESEGYEEESV